MEIIAAIPLLLIPFFLPLIAGFMAKSFGRRFWPWFFIGIILPFIANIILLCLPTKKKKTSIEQTGGTPVSNEEIFDHLVARNTIKSKQQSDEVYFSASA